EYTIMKYERDKFLTEAMGYTDVFINYEGIFCSGDDKETRFCLLGNGGFSTWIGFSKLLKWASIQDWWNFEFGREYLIPEEEPDWGEGTYSIPLYLIDPDNLANAVYEFLKGYKP
ncbi:MAG TPA: hypothetical protein VLA13_07445, partial [Massilibacterium sp.]|nr:hypothetical protein [Massilibacterium sp.]